MAAIFRSVKWFKSWNRASPRISVGTFYLGSLGIRVCTDYTVSCCLFHMNGSMFDPDHWFGGSYRAWASWNPSRLDEFRKILPIPPFMLFPGPSLYSLTICLLIFMAMFRWFRSSNITIFGGSSMHQSTVVWIFSHFDNSLWSPMFVQFPAGVAMQPGARYLQHQQAQPMTAESLMAARSSMLYAQQPLSALQQQASLNSQLGMISGANNGLHMLHSDASIGGNGALAARGFPDFCRSTGESLQAATGRGLTGAGKQDVGHAGSAEGRGGNAGGQNTDGTEPLYLKSSEEEAN